MLVGYTVFEGRVLVSNRSGTFSVVNDVEVGVHLALREPHKEIAVVGSHIEAEFVREVARLTAVEPHERLLETVAVCEEETFTPELETTLEPDFVGEGTSGGVSAVGRITVGLDEVLEGLLASGLIAGLGEGLGLDEDHFLSPHEREIVVVGDGRNLVNTELDVGVREVLHLDVVDLSGRNGLAVVPEKAFDKRGLEFLVNPPTLADVGSGNLVVEDGVDPGGNLAGGSRNEARSPS